MDWRALTARLLAVGMARGLSRADAADVAQEAVCLALEAGAADVEAYAVTCVRRGRVARRQRVRESVGVCESVLEQVAEPDQESVVAAKQMWFALVAGGCDVVAARCPKGGPPSTSAVRMARLRARRASARAMEAEAGLMGSPDPTPHL